MMQPLHTQHNLQKNKSFNLSEWVRKITQPLHTQTNATSQQMKSRNLSSNLSTKKIRQPLHKKNHAISPQKKSGNLKKNKSCNLIDWVRKITQPLHTQKACCLTTHKITQFLQKKITQPLHQKYHKTSPPQKNYATSPQNGSDISDSSDSCDSSEPKHKKIHKKTVWQ